MKDGVSTFRFRLEQAFRGVVCRPAGLLSLILVSCLVAWPLLGRSAVISMRTGERLIGDVLPNSDFETLYLYSSLLGELELPRDQIDEIVYEDNNFLAESSASSKNEPVQSEKPRAEVAAEKGTFLEQLRDSTEVIKTLKAFDAPQDWRGNVRLGVNLSSGNRKWVETFMKGDLQIDPRDSPNFYRFTGSYTYRETERQNGDTVISTDRYDANFTYRRDLSEKWFIQNLISWRVDQTKVIDRELQELIGLGIRFKPTKDFDFLFGVAGGIEELVVDFEDDRSGTNAAANFFQEASWKPFDKAKLVQSFNYFTNPEDSEQYSYILKAAFRYRLTDLLGFEFSLNQNFDNDVGDGNERDDARWKNALIVYF